MLFSQKFEILSDFFLLFLLKLQFLFKSGKLVIHIKECIL